MNVKLAGSSIPRQELTNRAIEVQSAVHPYQEAISAENDEFMKSLESYKGDTLGELKVAADTRADTLRGTFWKVTALELAFLGGTVASLVMVGGAAGAGMAAAGLACSLATGMVATNAQNQQQEAERFSHQLTRWGEVLEPPAPPPAPEPPAEPPTVQPPAEPPAGALIPN
ncbi:MAG: hypothetical protein HY319_20815 [Armatimonadetes bacterium]|nr:hypothetical protein [Armatimonadota bacterium]